MTLQQAPYFWVECDSCGTRCEYGDFAAWADHGAAIDGAMDQEWSSNGKGLHHCPNCPPFCANDCGRPAGDLSGERDYMCKVCFAAAADDAEAEERAT